MTIRKHVTIERDGIIEIRDPAFLAGREVEVDVTVQELGEGASEDSRGTLSIWDLAEGISASVPDVEWAEVPADLSVPDPAARLTKEEAKRAQPAEADNPPQRRSLTQRILEIGASVPLEEWDRLPRDLSMQLDHYLYGCPRNEALTHDQHFEQSGFKALLRE